MPRPIRSLGWSDSRIPMSIPSVPIRPLLFTVAAFCASGILAAGSTSRDALLAFIDDNFTFAAEQYAHMLEVLGDDPRLPRGVREGRIFTVEPEDWTSGFFPGSLWLIHEHTGDTALRDAAREYTSRVERIQHFTGHHDVGFMLGCSYGQGLRLTEDPHYRDVLLTGATSLATRFDPTVGAIRSWDFGSWSYPVIVDNMMNLELLTWAANESGDDSLRAIAVAHADTTLENHFRPDASSFHVVDYDPETGAVRGKQTAQGFADDSAWARGQSWALYGYTMMYRETNERRFLEQARRIADFLLAHPNLPADKIPYWDYDAPGIPEALRDTSAAAIMCSALIELSDYVEHDRAAEYLAVAETQLRALAAPPYRSAPGQNDGFILQHGVGHIPENHDVDVPLVYGDYYFLEALGRMQDRARLTYP